MQTYSYPDISHLQDTLPLWILFMQSFLVYKTGIYKEMFTMYGNIVFMFILWQ